MNPWHPMMPHKSQNDFEKARKVDLISLPPGMTERCANCVHLRGTFCTNPKVNQIIQEPTNECCGEWDNPHADRSKTQGEKLL